MVNHSEERQEYPIPIAANQTEANESSPPSSSTSSASEHHCYEVASKKRLKNLEQKNDAFDNIVKVTNKNTSTGKMLMLGGS